MPKAGTQICTPKARYRAPAHVLGRSRSVRAQTVMLIYALAIAVCAFALDAGERERAEVAEARELDNEWRMLREPVPRLESAADNALRRRRLDASARGRQLMQQMQAAANRGARQFRIPAGDYHFGHTRFELRNARNMEVTASGVSFWFGWGGGMRVMTSEGVKWTASEAAPFIIDYDPPVVAQGRVIRTDQLASGRWVDAEFSTDYIMPNRNQTGNIFGEPKVKVAFWDPASRTMRRTPNEAVNVYLDGSTSLAPACEPNTGRNCGTTWRIRMAGRTTAMHRLLRNGDLISMHPRVFPHAIELVACERVVFEDAHIYGGTNIGVVESKGVGSHVYRRIKVTRRPGSANLMSVNADGFHSNSAERKVPRSSTARLAILATT